MLNDYYEFTISETFLSAIFNGDESGLDDWESRVLGQFLECLPSEAVGGVWEIADDEFEAHFERCEITHLHSNCVTICLHFHNATLGESA